MNRASRAVKKSPKSFQDLPPIRVRREPPTVAEAVTAAQDLADDIEQQVEIACGLIGLSADEVRPHVIEAASKPKPAPVRIPERFGDRGLDAHQERPQERYVGAGGPNRTPRTVVVERRTRAPVIVERRGRPLEPRR